MLQPNELLGLAEDARRRMNDVAYWALCEVSLRRREELAGHFHLVPDSVRSKVTKPNRGELSFFLQDAWDRPGPSVSGIRLNRDGACGRTELSKGEDVLITLIHQLAHAYTHAHKIKDTSNRGHHHNRRFAEVAVSLGLKVWKEGGWRGYSTPAIASRYTDEYGDLITALDEVMALIPAFDRVQPEPVASESSVTESRDVFAFCRCSSRRGPRTILIARGSWIPGVIRCSTCDSSFTESFTLPESLTIRGQSDHT